MTEAIYKCDGCGKYAPRVKRVWLGVEVSENQSMVYRFCPDCADKLTEFLKELKEPEK